MNENILKLLKILDTNDVSPNIDDFLNELTIEDLKEIIYFAIEKKSLHWKYRMILQMVDAAPFSFWACDDKFVVRLWEAASTEIYGQDYTGKYFWQFVESKERKKALDDCLKIINHEQGRVKEFDNYYAIEEGNIGILTQSISLYDDINDEFLQGEIGLNIDLPLVQKKHEEIIKERNAILIDFQKKCDDLKVKLTNRAEETYEKINTVANDSQRKASLREKCSHLSLYFERDIEKVRSEAMLDMEEIEQIKNAFMSEFDKLDDSISNKELYEKKDESLIRRKQTSITRYIAAKESIINLIDKEKNKINDLREAEKKVKSKSADYLKLSKKYSDISIDLEDFKMKIDRALELLAEAKENNYIEFVEIAIQSFIQKICKEYDIDENF